MMSAAVYDVGCETRMIKTRKNMVSVRIFGSYKRKITSQDIDRPKNIKISKNTAIIKL